MVSSQDIFLVYSLLLYCHESGQVFAFFAELARLSQSKMRETGLGKDC